MGGPPDSCGCMFESGAAVKAVNPAGSCESYGGKRDVLLRLACFLHDRAVHKSSLRGGQPVCMSLLACATYVIIMSRHTAKQGSCRLLHMRTP